MEFLGTFSKNKKAYNKLTIKVRNNLTKDYLKGEFDKIEVCFVDGLFELYKLRELIIKCKAEIISTGVIASANKKYGALLFNSNRTFRSSWIERLILDKCLKMEKQKQMKKII